MIPEMIEHLIKENNITMANQNLLKIVHRCLYLGQNCDNCVGRESNPGQLLGRQLCSPLYHRRLSNSLLDTLFEETSENRYSVLG